MTLIKDEREGSRMGLVYGRPRHPRPALSSPPPTPKLLLLSSVHPERRFRDPSMRFSPPFGHQFPRRPVDGSSSPLSPCASCFLSHLKGSSGDMSFPPFLSSSSVQLSLLILVPLSCGFPVYFCPFPSTVSVFIYNGLPVSASSSVSSVHFSFCWSLLLALGVYLFGAFCFLSPRP